jgi:signal transduction histidine kinase
MKAQDVAREAEVRSYELLGRPPLPALQRIVATAAALCEVSNAEINVITASEQHHLAAVDANTVVARKEDSLCSRVIEWPDQHSVVPDARAHPEFSTSPFVSGALGEIVFYAATKLIAPSGTVIGTLCIFDDHEVQIQPEKMRVLDLLASAVVEVLESHREHARLLDLLARTFEGERELRQSHQRLEEFAGQVSHELQGPVSSIQVVLEMLHERETVLGDADLSFLVERGLRSSGRMRETIVDLMDFATLGGTLSPTKIDLTEVARDAVEDLGLEVGDGRIVVGELGSAYATVSPVRAVFSNLVSNAVKFSSTVGVPHVEIRAEQKPGLVRVVVADSGPGVPAEEQDRIFGLLVRGSTTVAGHGIGLATCAAIIAAHGGAIGVEDNPGGGAQFWFELPSGAPA